MPKQSFKIRVVSTISSSASGRLALTFAGTFCFTATLFATSTLPDRKLKAFATVRVGRSNTRFERLSLVLDGNHPASIIHGDFDMHARNDKLSPCSAIMICRKPLAVNPAGEDAHLDLDLLVACDESDDICLLKNNRGSSYFGSFHVTPHITIMASDGSG